jgi:hypothetical protein
MLEFLKHHYTKRTIKFDNKNLEFPGDLTKYLEGKPLDAYQMQKLLARYPNTVRNVGTLPKEWGVSTPELTKKVQDTFDKFREEVACISDKMYCTKASILSKMQEELSTILGKEVKITELEKGRYAGAYKISVSGAKDVVMKVFYKKPRTPYEYFNIHGQFVEPQRGIFLSKNSEQFAKTYFGKVATEIDRDGYIVTEFLEETGKLPAKNEYVTLKDYYIFGDDISEGHNVIDGKIFDFGDIHIVSRN